MKKIVVTIKQRSESYEILVGSGLITMFPELFNFSKYSSVTIITDSNVGPLHAEKICSYLHTNCYSVMLHCNVFPAGEKHKNLETVKKIYLYLSRHNVDRKGLIINVGGGVVTDLGGFVAAIYMRGVDFINIPTTIEGMVDASIGGKVGVNLGKLKNYVGAFHHPQCIIMDIDTISTLSERNLIAGFSEIIKYGLIADKTFFEFVTSKKPKDFSPDELINIIKQSCKIKVEIVQKDEKERDMRKLLNFGHTVGHAIESLCIKSNTPLFHGEAVAIGMIVASKISEFTQMISADDFEKIENFIAKSGLPIKIPTHLSIQAIIKMMEKDKKNMNGKIQWVLLNKIGSATINNVVEKKIILQAIRYVNN